VEIVFVRHAQPAWIAAGVGVANPGLTHLGTRQAQETAAALAGEEPYDELLISPMVRTAQTAEPIIEALGLEPVVIPGLAEITASDWEGTPAEEVARVFQEQRRRPLDDWWDGFPGGETFRQFHRRITETILEILADRGVVPASQPQLWNLRADPGRLLVVAHGGTDAVALGFLLGLEPVPWEWERFASPHASISRVRAISLADAHIFALTSFAEVQHLARVTY
jgi:probable phosphoglycerate mutase